MAGRYTHDRSSTIGPAVGSGVPPWDEMVTVKMGKLRQKAASSARAVFTPDRAYPALWDDIELERHTRWLPCSTILVCPERRACKKEIEVYAVREASEPCAHDTASSMIL